MFSEGRAGDLNIIRVMVWKRLLWLQHGKWIRRKGRGLEKSIKKLLKMFRQKGLEENIDTGARDKCLDKKDIGIQIQ